MQLDQKMLRRLLSLNDEQLAQVIRQIAADAGIDPAQIGLNPDNIQTLRRTLGCANDETLRQFGEVYDAYRKNAGHNR